MADFTMVVGARDEATRVLKNVRNETDLLERSVVSLQKQTEESVGRFEIVFAGLAGIATGVAAFIAGSKIKEVADDGIKAFQGQKDAAEKFAETLTLIDGRLKGLRDSEIDLKDTSAMLPAAFKLMDNQGLLAGSSESVQRFTESMEYSKKASEQAWASVGAVFAPFENALVNGYARIADTITAVLGPAIKFSEGQFAQYQQVVDWSLNSAEDAVISLATIGQVGFSRLGDAVILAMATGTLAIERFKNDSIIAVEKLHFGLVNPINAIGDQFFLMFHRVGTRATDLVKVAQAVVTDIGGIVNGKYDELFNRDSSEGFKFTPKLDTNQFESFIRDSETALAMQVADLAASLASDFSREFTANNDYLDKLKSSVDERRFEFKADIPFENNAADKNARANESLAPTESRLLTRGPSDGPLQNLVEEAKEQKELQKQTLKAIEENNRLQSMRDKQVQMELIV